MSFNMNDYQKEYQKEKYDRIELKIKKGSKEELKEYVKSKDMKVNEYIKELITNESGIEV